MVRRVIPLVLAASLLLTGLPVGAADGRLFVVQRLQNTSEFGSNLDGNFSAAVSPDGENVYVVARNNNALTVFDRDMATGKMTYVEYHKDDEAGVDGLLGAIAVVVSGDGKHVYVAGKGDDAISVFARNLATGTLAQTAVYRDGVGGVQGINGVTALALSPDGAHLYAAARENDSIAAFARNPTTGQLTWVAAYVDGSGGIDGLNIANAVTVSPDGAHVYAAGRGDSAVVVFSRNAGTGQLTLVEVVQNGVGGAEGLDVASGVAVSGDGNHVYVTANAPGGSVVAFARNGTTGQLTFIERYTNGVGGVPEGLTETYAVLLSPDGRNVYVTGREERAIVAFTRNPATGRLTFLQLIGWLIGRTLLKDPSSLAISPDGRFVYGNSFKRDTFAVLSRDICGNAERTSGEECDDGNTLGGDGCAANCTLEVCPPAPNPACTNPVKPRASFLHLADRVNDRQDLLSWSWRGTLDMTDIGDPLTTADHVLCVYDTSASPQPIARVTAPSADVYLDEPCWEAFTGGFKYSDRLRSPNGPWRLLLKAGVPEGRILVKGKGNLLDLPPLPVTPPVTVQLHNTQTGACWEAVFSAPALNVSLKFQAFSD